MTRSSSPLTGPCSRGRRRTSGGVATARCTRPRSTAASWPGSPGACSPRPRRHRLRGRGGHVPGRRPGFRRRGVCVSSIREVMPIVALDGRPIGGGRPGKPAPGSRRLYGNRHVGEGQDAVRDPPRDLLGERRRVGKRVAGMPVLLLTTKGRKTGRPRTSPMTYFEEDGAIVLVASYGGRPHNPDWFENLIAAGEGTSPSAASADTCRRGGDGRGTRATLAPDHRDVRRLREVPGEDGPRDPARSLESSDGVKV